MAACTPVLPAAGATITCTGANGGYSSSLDNITFVINSSSSVNSPLLGIGTALQLSGRNVTFNNAGTVDPSLLGVLSILSSGAKIGNASSNTINITNATGGVLKGTTGLLGLSLLTLDGMALNVQNGAGGTTTINNAGTISSSGLLNVTLLGGDAPVVAAWGGAQINMTNAATGKIIGRVAFEKAATGGNTFYNAGEIIGSVSLGQNGTNTFTAVTGSSVSTGGGVGLNLAGLVGVNLGFAATGIIDGGAGGNNTLVLNNPANSGITGTGTISSANYINFNKLTLNSGTWALQGPVVSNTSILNGGLAQFDSATAFGTGLLTSNGGAIQALSNGLTLGNQVALGTGGLTVQGANNLTLGGVVGGTGPLVKSGTGTLNLNGTNTYTGGTSLGGGSLTLGNALALGTGALTVGGAATLDNAAAYTLNNAVHLGADLSIAGLQALTLGGVIDGTGSLIKNGAANLTLSGNNTGFTGPLNILAGTVTTASASALGSSSGASVATGAALNLGNNASLGTLTGTGGVNIGTGTTLTLGGTGATSTFGGVINGAGGLTKSGTGVLGLTGVNTLTGITLVSGGTLNVGGSLASANVNVNSGATLTGTGSLIGAVNIANGGHLAATSGSTLNVGSLVLGSSANLDAALGAPSATGLIKVNGNLTLDGNLNVTDVGGFGTGVYRLIDYTGALSDLGLNINSIPANVSLGDLAVQTGASGQVNLVVAGSNSSVRFWDGAQTIANGIVDGGAGTWAAGTTNWTTINGTQNQAWAGDFGVFQGTAGAVSVVGNQSFNGLQFVTNGYSLNSGAGGQLTAVNGSTGNTSIRVDPNVTATVGVGIAGSGTLNKQDAGTLVLNGANTYTGGTLLNGGKLVVGNATALGSGQLTATTGTTLDSNAAISLGNAINLAGNLAIGGTNNLNLSGVISGAGGLIKNGLANLTLGGNNTFSGLLDVQAGSVTTQGTNALTNVSGANVASGAQLNLGNSASLNSISGAGSVQMGAGNALTIGATNLNSVFSGALTGAGTLIKAGTGTLALTGANTLSGAAQVNAGTLNVNGSLANSTVAVANGATLGGIGSLSGAVSVADGGHLQGSTGSTLSLGSLVLSNNANLDVGLAAPVNGGGTRLFNVGGNLTLDGKLNVTDVGGFGVGVYRLIDYTGSLTNLGLDIGSLPVGVNLADLAVQTGVNGQINLVVSTGTTPGTIRFWDGGNTTGNGSVDGGGGTWSSAGTNWTSADGVLNQLWANDFAVFQGAAGTVSVQGPQTFNGLQFLTDGYVLNAGAAGQLAAVNGSNGYTAVRVDPNVTATLNVGITGAATLNKLDSGTLVLNGLNTYAGGTQLTGGTLVVGNGTALGTGALSVEGNSTLDSSAALALSNAMNLGADLTVAGSNDLTLGGALSGTGSLIKNGGSLLRLNGTNGLTGNTQVNGGTLNVAGSLASANVGVATGATLTGNGSLLGAVNIADGGRLSASSGNTLSVGSLLLNANSNLDVGLGAPSTGGTRLVNINGNLTLDGKLNVTDVGGFGVGVYRLIDYSGSLTDLGIDISSIPANVSLADLVVQTAVNGQVNLVVSGDTGTIRFWDGSQTGPNGVVDGGSGAWGSGTNWTSGNGLLNQTWSSDFGVFQGTAGTVSVDGNQSFTGLQFVTDGYNLVTGMNGQLTALNGANGSTAIRVDPNVTAALGVGIGGAGTLNKLDSGTLVLNGANSYSGGTQLNGGTLIVGSDSALGVSRLTAADGTTLDSNTSVTLGNAVTVTGNLTLAGSQAMALNGDISGAGGLIKNGLANLTLGGNNSYLGPIALNAGGLILASNTALGSGALNAAGNTTLDTVGPITANNAITLAGNLGIVGSSDLTLNGVISGVGGLTKSGNNTLTLSGANTFSGDAQVNGGTLNVGGSLASANVSVNNGATLTGIGSLAGAVSVANGGHLAGSTGSTLSMGALTLNSGSQMDVALGAATGGPGLFRVGGNLVLDGDLNVTDAGGFGVGVYRLIDYTGSLSDLGLNIAAFPAGVNLADLSVQTGVNGQVNLVLSSQSSNLLFWDGSNTVANNAVDGGTGTWSATNTNWTSANGSINQAWGNDFAVFQGTAGTVTVDGNQTFGGLQFSSNYSLINGTNGQLTTADTGSGYAAVRVDPNVTATLGVDIGGTVPLNKLDSGTLVLSGNNSYSGGTLLNSGTLVAGSNSAFGSGALTAVNGTTLDSNAPVTLANAVNLSGDLAIGGSNALTLNGIVSGAGSLIKNGLAQLTLGGVNTYSGGTTLNSGGLMLGNGAALGTGALNVAGASTLDSSNVMSVGNGINLGADLTLLGSHDLTLTGPINNGLNSTGNLIKTGSSTLTLAGANGLTGNTQVNGGTLNVTGSLASTNVAVGSGAALTGTGTLLGTVNIASGGALNANSGSTLNVGSLNLDTGSNLNVGLAAPSTGGTRLINVNGNLNLNGSLNVTDIGGFGLGVYRLIDYSGVFSGAGLNVGSVPGTVNPSGLVVQTGVIGQVNLVVSGAGGNLQFWDGSNVLPNGTVDGGAGIWDASNPNWTDANGGVNAGWGGGFAVFQGAAGTVTVNGTQNVTGLQFLTDGYQLVSGTNGQLNAANGTLAVRVDPNVTATVGLGIDGAAALDKLDAGTLILSGANTYTGDTLVNGGTLNVAGSLASGNVQVNNGAALAGTGSLAGAVNIGNGGHLEAAQGSALSVGSLVMGANSNFDVALGAPSANGLVIVGGNLTLDGNLNVTDVGGFGVGVYRLIDYTGSLTDLGLDIANLPAGVSLADLQVQTSVGNQVNLVYGNATGSINFWDGAQTVANNSVDGGAGIWGAGTTNWTNADGSQNGPWAGEFAVFQGAAGDVTVQGNQTFNGLQFSTDGYHLLGGQGSLTAVAALNVNTSIRVDPGVTATLDTLIDGTSPIVKLDSGTLVLNGANTYSGGTLLQGGTLVVGNSGALGTGSLSAADGTTLGSSTAVNLGNDVNLGGGLTLAGTSDMTLSGVVGGNGRLIKNGVSRLVLNRLNTYTGGTRLNGGTLVLGNAGALGSGGLTVGAASTLDNTAPLTLVNDVALEDNLTVAGNNNLTLAGVISGAGSLIKDGSADVTLSGNNTFTGLINILSGSLTAVGAGALGNNAGINLASSAALNLSGSANLGGLSGDGSIDVASGHTLTVGGGNASSVFDGVLSGPGTFVKDGTGILSLTGANTHSGDAVIKGGTLNIRNLLASRTLAVKSGGTLSGTGSVLGDVTVEDGGHLAASTGSTLTLGSLALAPNALFDVALGAPVAGGGNALVSVNGNLTLDGTLNVTDIGGFGTGIYRLMRYNGALIDNGLALGTLPSGVSPNDLQVQTAVANQVNLLVAASDTTVQFWDGGQTTPNGTVDGGSGTWNAGSSNWTSVDGLDNDSWKNSFAVFMGAPGIVTVEGSQSITGLQFVTDGYVLDQGAGGELNAVNGSNGLTAVRVDPDVTATLNTVINGSGTLNKLDSGTLVLNGANGYTGGTALNGGALVVGNDNALGSGVLTAANGTALSNDAAVTLGNGIVLNGALAVGGLSPFTLAGDISGPGSLIKNDANTLILTGANTYSGGTALNGGSITGDTLSLQGSILNNAALTFAQNANGTYAGSLSGNGSLIKNGTGELLLTGNNGFTGTTDVQAGALRVDGSLNSASVNVASGATLGGSGQINGAVQVNSGATLAAGSGATPLSIGSLALASGSRLDFSLGLPGSATTLVNVGGDLTLDGTLNVSNAGGFGTGVYRLFRYGGNLTNNGLNYGTLPTGTTVSDLSLQTSMANQVNLLVASDASELQFWNGSKTNADGMIGGGDGVWGNDTNWTDATGTLSLPTHARFAVFGGWGGKVTVEGNQNFTGLQFLEDGYTLIPGSGGTLTPTNAADGSPAPVRVDAGVTTQIAASLVGAAGIEKLDAGTLWLTGPNTYSGGTTVSGGMLAGNTSSLQGNIRNNARLLFAQALNGRFNGTLSGTGELIKQGAGTLLLTGAQPFSGSVAVNEGTLQVGALDSPANLGGQVAVAQGAALAGNGTVAALNNNGLVQSGGDTGNLGVTGNFTNGPTGRLRLLVNTASFSPLAVGGVTTLGGTLQVVPLAPFTGSTRYTLLTSAGGVNGTFNTLDLPNYAFLDTSVSYAANAVNLDVTRNQTSFEDVAGTPNQQGVAGAVGGPQGNGLQSEILNLSSSGARSAFDNLSGEIFASTTSAVIEDSHYVRDALTERMRQPGCYREGDPRNALVTSENRLSSAGCQNEMVGWMRVLGSWGEAKGDSNTAKLDHIVSGFMLGTDKQIDDQWRVGAAAGYTRSDLNAHDRYSTAGVDSYHLAAYMNYQLDALAARFGAVYSWHDIESKRDVSVGNYSDRLKAKYDARTAQVFGEVGYTLEAGGVSFEPFAGLAHVDYDSDRAREKGGLARLSADSDQNITFSTVGVRAGKRIALGKDAEITPRGSIGWRHAYGDTQPDADLTFINGGASFSTQGVPIARDAAVVEAGMDFQVGEDSKLGIGYSGQLSKENKDHAMTISFSMGF
jgi:autotransporter-associated beta strand protein